MDNQILNHWIVFNNRNSFPSQQGIHVKLELLGFDEESYLLQLPKLLSLVLWANFLVAT